MKKILSIILSFMMIFSSIPDLSWAEEGNSVEEDYQNISTFAVTERNISTGNIVINTPGDYKIIGSSTTNTITVEGGVTANITLENTNISLSGGSSKSAFNIKGASTVNLTLSGTNILKSGNNKAGIELNNKSNLNINGTGSLSSTGGELGAGIGTGYKGLGGNITINSGEIIAVGGEDAAGIGTGGNGTIGNITINGGVITTTGGELGAGIGTGYKGILGNINIKGGVITATGGDLSSGIGSGDTGVVGNITINGGVITATGGELGAGIGTGNNGEAGNITITGGYVTATGQEYGAGIGSGYYGKVGSIAITGRNTIVVADGGENAADIGKGSSDRGSNISLSVSNGATLELKDNGINVKTISFKDCTIKGAGAGDYAGTYDSSGKKIIKIPAPTPTAIFEASTMILSGVTTEMSYSINGGSTWIVVTGTTVNLSSSNLTTTSGIKIKNRGNGSTTCESLIQTIFLTKATTPSGITKTDESSLNAKDGIISNVSNTMEYKKTGDTSYISISGTSITGLEPGSYDVRVKGSGTKLPSDPVTLSIAKYVLTPAPTPTAIFNAGTMKLTNITANMVYTLNGGTTWNTIIGIEEDLSSKILDTTNGIKIKDKGNGTTTSESPIQTITLTKATEPSGLTSTNETSLNAKDGIISNVSNTMEYKKTGDTSYMSISGTSVTGLEPGSYDVRVKGSGTKLPSDPVIITIAKYDLIPQPIPTAIFEASTMKLSNITTNMIYTLNNGLTWNTIIGTEEDLSSKILDITNGIKIKDKGNGTTTSESPIQTITLTKATVPSGLTRTDETSLNAKDGTISGVDSTMEYKKSTDGVYKNITGNIITGLEPGSYDIRVKGSGTKLPSDIIPITIDKYVFVQATTPTATFEASTRTLSNISTQMSYSLDNGLIWSVITGSTMDLSFSPISTANGIKIKDRGNGVTTSESLAQTITITKAIPLSGVTKTDEASLNAKDGAITNANNTMEYKKSTDSVYTSISGTSVQGLEPGSYDIRIKASGTELESDPITLTINKYVLVSAPTPSATFEASTKVLSNVTTQMSYSLDGGSTWKNITGSTVDISLENITTIYGIKVRDNGDGSLTNTSLEQIITITKALIPSGITKTDESGLNAEDGIISNLNNTMEYKNSSESSYMAITGGSITNLKPGSYDIRVRASGNQFESDFVTITIDKFLQTPAPTPTALFNPKTMELSLVTSDMSYSLDGGISWINIGGTIVDLSLENVDPLKGIKVRNNGNGTTTGESAVQAITITKMAVPIGINKIDETSLNAKDGKITGVDNTIEYKKSTDSVYTTITGGATEITGLEPGLYDIRKRATDTEWASDKLTLDIAAYTLVEATTPMATFEASTMVLSNVTTQMSYSLDNGLTWKNISSNPMDLSLENIDTTNGIKIKDKGNGTTTSESPIQTITLTKTTEPSGLTSTDETSLNAKDGKITSVDDTMEYKKSTDSVYTSISGGIVEVTGLSPGMYEVRTKGSGTELPSDKITLTINKYNLVPAITPSAVLEGNIMKLKNVTTHMSFSLDGGNIWSAVIGTEEDLTGEIIDITKGIKVKDNGDGNKTSESQIQDITITKGVSITGVTSVDESSLNAKDGKLTGVDSTMEYKKTTDSIYTTISTGTIEIMGLEPGLYELRTKGSTNQLPGDILTLTINKYNLIPAATPTAIFDASTMTLSNVTTDMAYTLNSGLTGNPILGTTVDLSYEIIDITHGIKIKRRGDGITTSESAIQYIQLIKGVTPSVISTNESSLNAKDGEIGNVDNTMEYKKSIDSVYTSISGTTVTGLEPGSYDIRIKGVGTQLPSDITTVTIDKYALIPAATPTATFDASTMTLSNVTTDMAYTLNNGLTGNVITGITVDLSYEMLDPVNGIKIKRRGDGILTSESGIQYIQLTKRVAPLGITVINETSLNAKDGEIGNLDTTMEYKKSTDSIYTSISGATVTGLEPGSYDIRTKGVGTQLPSDIVTITIDKYDLVPALEPTATFDASTMILSNVTTDMSYSLDNGLTWNVITGTTMDLSFDTVTATNGIKVKNRGDGITTSESDIQTINITQGVKPVVTKKDESKTNGKDGKILGVNSSMEYKESGKIGYKAITGTTIENLSPGFYDIRTKATGNQLPSDVLTIEIKKYSSSSGGGGGSSSENDTDIKAKDIVEKTSTGEKNIVVTPSKDLTDKNIKGITVSREAELVLKNSTIDSFTIKGKNLDLTFDKKLIEEMYSESIGDITLEAKPVDKLSNLAKIEIENRPVYEIKISYKNNGKTEYLKGFKIGKFSVNIKYEKGISPYGVYVPNSGLPEKINVKYSEGKVLCTGTVLGIYGVGEEKYPIKFTDTIDHWGKENIDFITGRKLFLGTSETEFSPNAPITRGMFITVIGRLSGENVENYKKSSFTDVGSEMYYSPYIEWAVENKIVTGVGDNKFEPNRNITREELAKMLKGFSDTAKYKLEENQKKIDFRDKDSISDWSKESIEALQKAGIINGLGDNTFAPKGTATRAEAATMLGKFVKDVFNKSARYWTKTDDGIYQYTSWNGEKAVGLKTIDSKKYYFETDGTMVSDKTVKIEGKDYYFGEDGVMVEK